MKRNEGHAFINIEKDIKANKIPSIVLLCGTEEYLVNFYAEQLISKYVKKACKAIDLVRLDRDKFSLADITENIETMPIMSDRKVVFLPDLYNDNGKLPKTFEDNKEKVQEFCDYLKSLVGEGTLLLITFAGQADARSELIVKKSAIYNAIKEIAKSKNAAIYDFGMLEPSQLHSFIEKRLRNSGKRYRQSVVDMIAHDSGYLNKNIDYGLFNLENDLIKIIAHCGEAEEITPSDVAGVITVNPENNIFAMLDAIGRNRKDEAFRLLHNLLEDGNNEFLLLGMINGQLELMLRTCEMKDEGISLSEIQKRLKQSPYGIHEFRTKKALEAGNRFGVKRLRDILLSAYEVELNIKTGLMPGRLALEYFVAGI